MFNIPNCLSFLRVPLAFVFLQTNPTYRVLAILLAMLSDGLDGFIARRYGLVNRLGTLLDPMTDKFFVSFALVTLVLENKLQGWQAALMLCRDLSVVIYGCYLALRGRLANYQFRAIWCGKITTALQLIVLLCLTIGIQIPALAYFIFALLGVLALGELYFHDKAKRRNQAPT